MASDRGNLSRKMAAIVHADVTGSTALVQLNEALAHERINQAFNRFSQSIKQYGGTVHEIRGDALVAEFSRASDAVCAALAFQASHSQVIDQLDDEIIPKIRIGVSLGEVIFADGQVTGAGVVLAQRVEQLAEPGGLCITAAIHEALPQHMPFIQKDLGEQQVKGFDEPVRVYTVRLKEDSDVPDPTIVSETKRTSAVQWMMVAAVVVLICGGGLLAWLQPWAPDFEPVSPEAMAQPLPAKPSIAVLPFDDLSIGEDQGYLSDAISEGIITELSRFSELFVIARNSSFQYRDKATDVRDIARDLGVRYILEGSQQKAGDRLRVTVQLIDAVAGNHVWAERYDRELLDIFIVQDEIVHSVTGAVGRKVVVVASEQANRADPSQLRAFEHWLRGVHYIRQYTEEGIEKAQQALLAAIEADPNLSHGHVGLAFVHLYGYRHGWTELNPDEALAEARASAQRALDLAPNDYSPYHAMTHVETLSGERERAIARFQRALDLNPNAADVMPAMAEALSYAGRWQEAVDLVRQAMRLDPHHPPWFNWNLGWMEYFIGECESALSTIEAMPRLPNMARRTLAVIHVCLGQIEEARAVIAELLRNEPGYSIAAVRKSFSHRFADSADLEHWIADLRKAGLSENPPLKLPDKPSIAVLPFNAYSDESEQKHFANGLTEDLTTALSKVPDIFVIASTSTQKYKGKDVDVREVAKEQGVRYVLEGSIQKSGDNVRINAQLVDGADGKHVWAEKYDRPATDFFAIQDDIVRQILVAMQIELTEGEHARLAASGTDNLQAWLLRLQAYDESIKLTRESQIRARELYEAAHKADPNWAMPVAGPSFTHWYEARRGWSDSREESIRLGIESAERAIALQPDEWIGYMALCNMMFMIEEIENGVDTCRKAVKLAPNSFAAVGVFAIRLSEADREHEAIELFERAICLSPQYPWWIDFGYGFALHLVERKEEAIDIYRKAIDKGAQSAPLRVRLAAVYVDLGRMDEAKAAIDEALKINPQFTASKYRKSYPYPGDERYDWYHDLIIRAGLPQ